MSKKTVRNNDYYEDRLKRDHPTIYADLKAGKYRTVTDAALAAGLKSKRTRLHEMKNAWEKASGSEKKDFLLWVQQQSAGTANTVASNAISHLRIYRRAMLMGSSSRGLKHEFTTL